jgi:hypothetical protein
VSIVSSSSYSLLAAQRRALRAAASMAGMPHAELVESQVALAFKFLLDYGGFRDGGDGGGGGGARGRGKVGGARRRPPSPPSPPSTTKPRRITALLVDVGVSGVTASVVTLRRGATAEGEEEEEDARHQRHHRVGGGGGLNESAVVVRELCLSDGADSAFARARPAYDWDFRV